MDVFLIKVFIWLNSNATMLSIDQEVHHQNVMCFILTAVELHCLQANDNVSLISK